MCKGYLHLVIIILTAYAMEAHEFAKCGKINTKGVNADVAIAIACSLEVY